MQNNQDIEFKKIQEEYKKLTRENIKLKRLLVQNNIEISIEENSGPANITAQNTPNISFSTADKIKIYRSLFRGRENIYAKRWESKNGRAGYSPACANEWNRHFCQKPKIKCAECNNRKLLPITDQLIYDHLKGDNFIGIYPLLEDETCYFLAIDFDKDYWKEDTKAFTLICQETNIPYAIELSQSGNGAHIWIFFSQAIPANLARKLGSALLTKAMQKRHQISLASYDRLFPNQDTMPKGGFGNLIASPLQGSRRKENKSIFLDDNLSPIKDQWDFLNNIRKLSFFEANVLVKQFVTHGEIIDIRDTQTNEEEADPWVTKILRSKIPIINEPLPSSIKIVLANLVYIDITSLPSTLINILKKLAAFQNPEFYKAQAMRLPTYSKPRVIGCAEEFSKYLGLPRGCLEDVKTTLREYSISPDMTDETFAGNKIKARFNGTLKPEQKTAISALQKENFGILAATTGFGKTVIAAKMIAKRKTNTLILVHRQQLMDQWQEQLSLFLNISSDEIGIIGGGKNKPTKKIDVAMLQSLFRKGEINPIVSQYGQIIVDECHHISAFSFEQVLKRVKAKYVLGLTATPIRKDGHHPIIIMQCGPILFKTNAKDSIKQSPFEHVVNFRYTDFQKEISATTQINDIFIAMIENEKRNELIFNDVITSLEQKRSPLLLTERTQHLEYFETRLRPFVKNLLVLKGGMGKKQREAVYNKIAKIPDDEERLIIATGRYIGEGFDNARLDTLFLTMPISWQGTLQQYIGRLHRNHDNKKDVIVYDYVDQFIPTLDRMYKKRLKKYKAIGYKIT